MRVNVVFARVGQAWEVDLECPTGTTVIEAITQALVLEKFKDVALSGDETFAVWNQVVDEDHLLQDGDRVEILRDLVVSPMERRRTYAKLTTSD